MPKKDESLIPLAKIESRIFEIRGKQVILDFDLSELYGVTTKAFNQAIRRNLKRFPDDFMFQLDDQEFTTLRSQSVTTKLAMRRFHPYAFTEHGVIMAASILNSTKAVEVSVYVTRAFVRLRRMAISNLEVEAKFEELDGKIDINREDIQLLFETMQMLMLSPGQRKTTKKIGFPEADKL